MKGAKSPFRVQSSSFLNFSSSENWTGSGAKRLFRHAAAAPGEEKKGDDQRTFRMVLWTLHRPEPCSGLAAYGSLGFCRIRRQRNERHQQDRVRHGKCFRFCMARFLFFLKEKEKDGFKNVSLSAMVGKMRVASGGIS